MRSSRTSVAFVTSRRSRGGQHDPAPHPGPECRGGRDPAGHRLAAAHHRARGGGARGGRTAAPAARPYPAQLTGDAMILRVLLLLGWPAYNLILALYVAAVAWPRMPHTTPPTGTTPMTFWLAVPGRNEERGVGSPVRNPLPLSPPCIVGRDRAI